MKINTELIYVLFLHFMVYPWLYFVNIITKSSQGDDHEGYPVDTNWALWIPNRSFSPFWHHEFLVIAKSVMTVITYLIYCILKYQVWDNMKIFLIWNK